MERERETHGDGYKIDYGFEGLKKEFEYKSEQTIRKDQSVLQFNQD